MPKAVNKFQKFQVIRNPKSLVQQGTHESQTGSGMAIVVPVNQKSPRLKKKHTH